MLGDTPIVVQRSPASSSLSISTRNGRPWPSRCCWPATSSRVRGRKRLARGALDAAMSAAALAKRSLTAPTVSARPVANDDVPLNAAVARAEEFRVDLDHSPLATQLLTLDELLLTLGEMVQYKNYEPRDPMNSKAAAWAMGRKTLFPIDRRELKGQSVADLIVIGDEESDDLGIKFG